MLWKNKTVFVSCFVALLTLFAQMGLAAEPSMATYTSYPIFQINTVAPNILIILDNSNSMNEQAYWDTYDHSIEYYGYFEPYKKYSYGSNIFVRDPAGPWDGNFLNWLTMRKIDVARKVLMGGLATSRMGSGNQTNIGETPAIAGYDYMKTYTDTDNVTPFDSSTNYSYLMDGGNFYVNAGVYVIRVDKNMNTYPDEAPSFVNGNIAGVLQKIGDKARWGNMFFNYGTGNNGSGGSVMSTIGTNMSSLVTDLQNTSCNTWTPLAEAMYVATQYFKQEEVASGLDYPNGAAPHSNVGDDPYYNGTEFVHCAKSFVLLITDGMSTMDLLIPDELKDFDGDGNDSASFTDSGSDYLDDVAYYARTTDLRSPTVGKSDLEGEQNLILYTVYAFGNDPVAKNLLKDASKNGGYWERNGQKGPDLLAEWDANGDGDPDTYYEANTGYLLEAKILQAINDILARAASGTAVSVLSSSSEGEGNLVQAYYRPAITQGITEYKWLGYLQSLWVDPMGNLREDTNHNSQLDLDADKALKYFLDPGTGDTMLKRYDVSGAAPYPDFQNDPYELVLLDEIVPLWEAGTNLALTTPVERKIFTFLDINGDGLVDESVHDDPFDKFGEVIGFDTINDNCGMSKNCIRPFLGVKDDLTWGYLGADLDTRVDNLIEYIRGEEIAGLRPRFKDAMNNVWKLADIVNSTPVSVNRPVEDYHIIYSDESYQEFLNALQNRETIVYAGANDGMLHAFTSWEYDAANKAFNKPAAAPGTESMGDEIWAYIPQPLLPHLKWLPSPNYTHVYYVDLKPKVFDAKILPDDTYYVDADSDDNWGTFLLLGLNMGGKYIPVTDDFDYDAATADTTRDFYPSYTLLNVTDPRDPKVIWERTYADLELGASIPAIVRVKDKWFAVFGSGPSDYDGTSNKKGHVFVVDLKTGNPYGSGGNDWLFETAENNAFMNSPVSLDEGLNFNVDAIYFGETYLSGSWKGKMYKINVPWVDASGNYDGVNLANYVANPLDPMYPWQFAPLFNATRPITAPVSVSRDEYNNIWIFGGTGRYLSNADKANTDTQYLFGLKDPFYNIEHTPAGLHADDYYLNYNASLELAMSDLLNTDQYVVATTDEVFDGGGTSVGNFEDMKDLVYVKDGWYRTLSLSKERIIEKPSLLGGMVYAPSFVPNGDICGYGGESYLYGLYYETGTAYFEPGFENNGTTTVDINGQPVDQVVDKTTLGYGKASSLGIHVGQEEGAKGYIQQSTGTVLNEDLTPALNIKSGLRCWREK
jgi:type IV pilus assembly protein PilY1